MVSRGVHASGRNRFGPWCAATPPAVILCLPPYAPAAGVRQRQEWPRPPTPHPPHFTLLCCGSDSFIYILHTHSLLPIQKPRTATLTKQFRHIPWSSCKVIPAPMRGCVAMRLQPGCNSGRVVKLSALRGLFKVRCHRHYEYREIKKTKKKKECLSADLTS